jgi:putative transposase
VLSQFGNREGDSKSGYRRFVGEGVELGRRPELVGGWAEVKSQRRWGKPELADERILGSGDFVERVIRHAAISKSLARSYSS